MTLKAELTKIVEGQRLTALLQALVANQSFQMLDDADSRHFDQGTLLSSIGTAKFKESVLVFSDSGAYTDIETVLSLLEEIANSPRPPIKTAS